MRCTRMLGGSGVAASGVVWLVDATVSLFPSGVTFLDECSNALCLHAHPFTPTSGKPMTRSEAARIQLMLLNFTEAFFHT